MYKIMDGNEACSFVAYNFAEVAGIYPITPSSTMAENIDKYAKEGKLNFFNDKVKVVQMQSEAGVAGFLHGTLSLGTLTTTFTSSQGLLLMIPNMYKIAGEQLPLVINVAARSLATHALSIMGDHQDIYATRQTGFAILANSSVQDVMDLTSVAYLSSIKGGIPFINFFDGFRTSHELNKIEVIDTDKIKPLLDKDALQLFRNKALNIEKPFVKGTAEGDDIYFQVTEAKNTYYDALPDIVNEYMNEINKITNREYHPFNYYGAKNAKRVIVAMGSVCDTVKETIDYLVKEGEDVGLIEVHLYRPFSKKYLMKVLPKSVTDIAVLDRTKEHGSNGEPLYLDIVNFVKSNNLDINVIGGRYGLSSKNTTPADIKSIYDHLTHKVKKNNFTISINDDVTNLSLPKSSFVIPKTSYEMLIYGYGSDGMVSCSKDIIKIVGSSSNAFVQGYFEYDSKKSGGVTKCHLRFSGKNIRSTYYVTNPDMIVCTKDSYLSKFNILEGIEENGTFLLNTNKSGAELVDFLPNRVKNTIVKKHLRFLTVDALKIALKNGLDNKISSIMETIIFNTTKLIDKDFAINEIKISLTKRFENKGNNVLEKNLAAIKDLNDQTKEIILEKGEYLFKDPKESILTRLDKKEGNDLSVSEVKVLTDGIFPCATSKLENKNASDKVPVFIKENCIMCNQCSFVCPHAVIRPFLLDEDEYIDAPNYIKESVKDSVVKGKKFIVAIDTSNCTGCGLCVNICPGKNGNKALEMKLNNEIDITKQQDFKYLNQVIKEKHPLPIDTVVGSQFVKPRFEFSGACQGCGETPYLKLLTQLFEDRLVIANATGCSSIYGGSVPSIPYNVPWANSLFEDNAEFGYGMKVADNVMKERIKELLSQKLKRVDGEKIKIFNDYIDNLDKSDSALFDYVKESKDKDLLPLMNYIRNKSFWIVGGDGWAYDIGFSGIDHVLANHENVNILVLDTEVYSNTGGQTSKSTRTGAIAKFNSAGKSTTKKDLVKIALTYPHVYVGTISLGASFNQAIKTLKEAESYNGPSIVIAYSPCIAHGILKGMSNSIEEEKQATLSGYFPLINYSPVTKEFKINQEPDFDKYYEFITGEDRYKALKKINPDNYKQLLEDNKKDAINTYEYYKSLITKDK